MIVNNVDSNGYQFKLILVDDLNPEDIAMVQALKARSAETSGVVLGRIYAARREAFRQAIFANGGHTESAGLCLDDVMDIASHNDASALARRIHRDYAVGYGHKSIADCGSTTIIVEGVSMLAAKAIENTPLYSGQETSTRAVDMTKVRLVDPIGTSESRAVQQRFMDFYASSWDATADEVRRRYPRREGEDEAAYEKAVKSRTFDVLRAWIPAGATTHVSITMNLRQFGDHLTTLLLHPLAEVREIAKAMQGMLRERYPSSGSFGGAAGVSGVGTDGREDERTAWNRVVVENWTYHTSRLFKDSYADTLDRSAMAALSDEVLWANRPRGCTLPHFISDLGQVTCQFTLDFASYRDIHRHRNGVCRMPLLTAWSIGFEPWYLEQLPDSLRDEARRLLRDGEQAILAVDGTALDSQYLTPMGYRVPVSVTYGLPAFVYVVELRSTPQVHPTLRRAVLQHMVKPFHARHPEVQLHVDETEDPWDLRRGQQTIERRV